MAVYCNPKRTVTTTFKTTTTRKPTARTSLPATSSTTTEHIPSNFKRYFNFTCPRGFQALHTFHGAIDSANYPPRSSVDCVQFENPSCVQECYWASVSLGRTWGDCSFWWDVRVAHNDIYFSEKKAVYVNGFHYNLDGEMCAIQGTYVNAAAQAQCNPAASVSPTTPTGGATTTTIKSKITATSLTRPLTTTTTKTTTTPTTAAATTEAKTSTMGKQTDCSFQSQLNNQNAVSVNTKLVCEANDCTKTACRCTLRHGLTETLSPNQCLDQTSFAITNTENHCAVRKASLTNMRLACSNGQLTASNFEAGKSDVIIVATIQCPALNRQTNELICPVQ